ncbi:GMP/IMP nucleotidase [Parendozoicomonas haliclonae]|uniref:GMP/IMP nucleotidase YrfG n=1 Tax=Parendozoicomonas haliclonae TaxID=1960125 RepID=A0A1X7AIR4_9GAMM|nr:GMP/IMP nucleotidase [Parendozoicomonas haliclonae]SMA45614.1 GMP/IMP nucleotidase YrfG [Parendozoicomonas haliclonae]
MLPWSDIDTVIFDMDGTLLDLHFDSYFWKQLVPERYGAKVGISPEQAWEAFRPKLEKVAGTLEWYCFDYWAKELDLDIMAMKRDITHKIRFRPAAEELLKSLRASSKDVVLATNSNRDGLELKMEFIPFAQYFDALYSAHDFGLPKEEQAFWHKLASVHPFDPERTLFVDDNLDVLRSAQTYGIKHLLAIAQPDLSRPVIETGEFAAADDFNKLLPVE